MKTLLYILGGLVLLVVILHVIAPKTYQVERKVVVKQQLDTVFQSLCSLEEQQNWSPWAEMDPEMEIEFKGKDGAVGSITHWKGNKEVGEGEQEIVKIEPDSYIETEVRFLKPFKSTSTGFLKLKEIAAEEVEVTWGFKGENKFPATIMMLFMDMDKAMGKDFEKGLATFKNYIEKKTDAMMEEEETSETDE